MVFADKRSGLKQRAQQMTLWDLSRLPKE